MTHKNDNPPITTLDSRIAWECPWYRIRQDRIRLPDGSEGVYNVVTKCEAVWIVPVTAAGEIVLIHNYRHTLSAWCWELPAGGIKDGQTPLEAAREELLEEVGGLATDWRSLIRVSTMNGLGDEYGYVFLATGVTLGEPHHEPTEVMTVHTVSLAKALNMARAGEINDSMGVMALLLAEPMLINGEF